jgi:hypothetical protein
VRSALAFASSVLLAVATSAAAAIPSPSAFLKLDIGADKVLADYRQIRSYFNELDKQSPRVQVVSLGKTTLGEDMFMAVISAEANMTKLERLKEISHKLSDPRGLSDAEIAALAREGKAFVLVTCNIHSTEIGSSQMAMEWAYALATTTDAPTLRHLDDAVLLLVPSLNPDGQIMETEWYRKYLGTKFEGGRMPWLYHHYVGHDDNRDWFMLTQKESIAMSRAVYHEWYPQVWLDEHQMGNNGPRIFTPPYSEPVDADIHPLVWREVNLIGSDMSLRLEQAGKFRRHLRLLVRRLLARRHQEHRVVQERQRSPDRGGVVQARHAAVRGPERAGRRPQGARRLRTPGELPQSLAGRLVAAARHHGLRAHRPRMRCSRRARTSARDGAPRHGHAREGRDRPGRAGRGLSHPQGTARLGFGAPARGAAGRAPRRDHQQHRGATCGSRWRSRTACSCARCSSRSATRK